MESALTWPAVTVFGSARLDKHHPFYGLGVTVGERLSRAGASRVLMDAPPPRENVRAFDQIARTLIDLGLSAPRPLEVDEAAGLPDGLCVDATGFVWSAHWGGWRITRYSPDGAIDRVIELPVPNVTSLAFGGTDLDRLFVTTARLGLSDDELVGAPLSGGLFVVDAGAVGLPEARFAG